MDALRKTAEELDIDPAYLDQAVTQLAEQRAAAARQKAAASRILRSTVLVTAAVSALCLLVGGLMVSSAAAEISAARAEAARGETRLTQALDRQAALVPQLVALAGGDHATMRSASEAYRDARTLSEKERAAAALSLAMAEALAGLPPATDADQARLNLQYELTGSQNRVSTEAARYEEARLGWEGAASTTTGRAAVGLGLADAPAD
jgi:LemA protein